MRTVRMPPWLAGIVGAVSLIALWWLLAVVAFRPEEGTTFTPVPTPWAVFEWLFVDGNIAGLYGLDGVTGANFQRVTLDSEQRSGLLTSADTWRQT